jgi:N-ethylmaleimide reductase
MSPAEIALTIQEFVQAAKNAVKAGLDGVELHGANGYLLEQFLNPHVNTRTDEYGGSLTNRSRFVLEVVSAIADAIGKDKVGIRLSPYNTFNDMPYYDGTFDTYDYLVKEFEKLGILYVHIVESAARELEEGRRLVETIREHFSNLLILNGGYTGEKAEKALESGKADLIAFGMPFISNPDFPERVKNSLPLASSNTASFYSADQVGYTDYPFYK